MASTVDVHITPPLRARITQLVRARFGDVRIQSADVLSPADAVWRLNLTGEPRAVIAKVARTHHADPRAGTDSLLREERSLRALEPTGIAPVVLTSESGAILILEDVGDRSLSDVLTASDPTAAARAFTAYARALGVLHATALHGEQDTTPGYPGAWLAANRITEHWNATRAAAALLGVLEPNVDDEIASVIDALAEPGEWLAFTNGDPCPGNVIIAGDGVRLIDFEGASFQHALLDAASLRFPFAWCTPWGLIPTHVRADAERAYRTALAARIPEASDDDAFERALAPAMWAWMNLRLRRLAVIDAPGPEAIRRRTQILRTIEAFLETTARARTLPALSEWAMNLDAVLRARWPAEAAMQPLYPAFA